MTAPFRTFVVDQTADGFTIGILQLEQPDLPPGDVLIQVAYAALSRLAKPDFSLNPIIEETFQRVPKYTLMRRCGKHITKIFYMRRNKERLLAQLPWYRRNISRYAAGKLGVLLLKLGTRLKEFELTHTTLEDHQ